MMVPSHDPFAELRMKEHIANKDRTMEKLSRRAALMMLAIVLIVTIAGITLFYTLGH